MIFVWTPPHFWALAVKYRDDYRAANVPMLPAVATMRFTAIRIIAYTVVLWALSMLFSPVAKMGPIYFVSALLLGGVFLWFAVALLRDDSVNRAMRLFSYSISYVTLLFGAMAIDQVVKYR